MLSAAAQAQTTGITDDGFAWSSASGAVTITGYSGAGGAVNIPGTISVSGTDLPVTGIGGRSFYRCDSLTSVTIPNSVTSIANSAFDQCGNLTSVTIGNGVTSIGSYAFSQCGGLTMFTVDLSNPAYSSSADGVLFDKNQTTIVRYPNGKSGSYTIPNSVISIGSSAFASCSLTSVTIGNCVTSIGDYAFTSCRGLTRVTISNSVTSIGERAFIYTSLTNVTIPDSVTSIGPDAFEYCQSLTSVTIGKGVTSIGYVAFGFCNNLTSAYFMGNAPSMGAGVFYAVGTGFTVHYYEGATGFSSPTWCGYPTQLDARPILPTITSQPVSQTVLSVATITFTAVVDGNPPPTAQWQVSATGSAGPFTDIDSVANPSATTGTLTLTNVTPALDGCAYRAVFTNYVGSSTTTAATLTVIQPTAETTANGFAWWSASGAVTITGYSGTGGALSIPSTIDVSGTNLPVTGIGISAFNGCTGLTSVTIPDSVTSIGSYAFFGCSGLTSVTIPNSVTSIGASAFDACNSLTSVLIGTGITSIGDKAFLGCKMLPNAVFLGNAPTLGSSVFDSTADGFTVYYSNGATGFASPTWNGYPTQDYAGLAAPAVTTHPVSQAGLSGVTITFTAAADGNPPPTVQWQVSATGTAGPFSNIPGNSSATTGTLTLTNVTTAQNGYAYQAVFANTSGNSTTSAGTLTVYPITGTTAKGFVYTTDPNLKQISITGYSGANGEVNIPDTINGMPVTGIGSSAFIGHWGLTRVTIPNSVTSIGASAFERCFVENVAVYIGSDWSYDDIGLTSVLIGTGVTSIGDNAFLGCKMLPNAVFLGNAPTLGSSVFDSTASGFTVYYSNGATLFSSPTWNGYPTQDYARLAAPAVTTHPLSQTVFCQYPYAGTTVTFTAAADGNPPPTVQWQVSATGTAGPFSNIPANASATTGTLTLTNVTPRQNAYQAVFTNVSGSTITAAATLTVYPIIGSYYSNSGMFDYRTDLNLKQITISGFSADKGAGGVVNIPDTINGMPVTGIDFYAFSNNKQRTSVTIPSSVTSIGDSAFASCDNLTSAYFMGNAPSMAVDVFRAAAPGFTVYYYNNKTGFSSPAWNGYPTVNMGDSSPSVAAWLQLNGLPSTVNLLNAPNGDGVPLLLHYALNLDPTRNQGRSLPKPVFDGNNLSFTHYAGNADVTYTVQSSPDLKTWTPVTNVSAPDANGFRTATVPITSGTRRFMRLFVSH